MQQQQKEQVMNIRIERKRKGMSQLRLAFHAKVSRYRLFLHEQGIIKLNFDEIGRIKIALAGGSDVNG